MLSANADAERFAQLFGEVALEAGAVVLQHYRKDLKVVFKDDGSPLTAADEAANELILRRLRAAIPSIPVVTEESDWRGLTPADIAEQFVLVDPLDGTREFVAHNDEFTVNIALIRSGNPVAGAVYAPALGQLYTGGTSAWVREFIPAVKPPQTIATRAYPARGLTAGVSRSHFESETASFLQKLPIAERVSAGSSLKFCRIAEGAIDVYPRFGATMEWDTAAGHAVLAAAGGKVLQPDGSAFLYGKMDREFRNGAFIAWGRDPLN